MQESRYPFSFPLYVMLKPAGPACNMRCDYCYYLSKTDVYPDRRDFMMSDEVLEEFTRLYLGAQTMRHVMFTWHGGEALLRGIGFYRKALALQRKYARGHIIENSIQTNGTLLNDEWCRFLKEHDFLVGISVDGPERCHDRYRRMAGGGPSFGRVMKGIDLLRRYGVDFNVMGVVNDCNAECPLEFYDFFRRNECRYIQFSPIVETVDGRPAPWNVTPEKWGAFLVAVFDEWVKRDVGDYFVQYFDATLANWVGEEPGMCSLAPYCGTAGVMEFNGDVYSCDHFVYPEYRLGNIGDKTLVEMMYSERQAEFGRNKRDRLPAQCRECRYLFACNGECPKNRIAVSETGERGLNYLCAGYRRFFAHVAPYMDFMKNELENGRPPSNVMEFARRRAAGG